MTLTVKIKNDGNQPDDVVMFYGVESYGDGYIRFTDNPANCVILAQGEEISCYPPSDHFDDPVTLGMKGKQ